MLLAPLGESDFWIPMGSIGPQKSERVDGIREVIAFPKTASAIDLMCESPAGVEPEQLDELGLKIKND